MKKRDGRSLSHATLEEIRIRAVQRVEEGESAAAVTRTLGLADKQIFVWLREYRKGGIAALRAKPIPGRPPRLVPRQRKWLERTLINKNPQQLRFAFALWTLPIIRELIKRECKVTLTTGQISRILKTMGITAQRPLYRAWQQDPEAVKHWLEVEYPAIKAEAKRVGAVIFFQDEAGIRTDHHAGTTWGKKGCTPVVLASGARRSMNMASAISPRGSMRFMIYEGTMNAPRFISFLKRLMKGARRPIFLVVDGHSSHKAVMVRRFVESLKGRLKLFRLPSYSPERNPQEYVWNPVKMEVKRQVPVETSELRHFMHGSLRSIQKQPAKVKSFFQTPETMYAA